jgi:hypothetical protein
MGMGNGKWEMGNGKWEMGNGKWEMGNGKWEWEMDGKGKRKTHTKGERVSLFSFLFSLHLAPKK